MPTILNEDLAWEWLFGGLDEKRTTEIALTQYPSDGMQACTIAKTFRSSTNPTEPFHYEFLPPLDEEEKGGKEVAVQNALF